LFERARRPLTKSESDALSRDILAVIEPFNIAGLGRAERRNWYPVEATDLFESANRVGATREEISDMLRRCGFATERELISS
jgi:FADH2 O2-dependent halogenase